MSVLVPDTVTLEHHLATLAMVRREALAEARRSVARRVHLVGELDTRIVEDCVAAIDALRGAT